MKKLRDAVVPIVMCEALEERRLLSFTVGGDVLAGPILTPGTSWTYALTTADGDTADFTRTVIGPTTFEGHSVIEVDTLIGLATNKAYLATNAAGDYVIYGEESTTTTFGDDYDVYAPYQLLFPVSLTQGVGFTNSYSDFDTHTDLDGNSDDNTYLNDQTITVIDEKQSISTPYQDFVGNVYTVQIDNEEAQVGTDGNPLESDFTSFTQYCVAGIGFVYGTSDGNIYELTDFNTNTEHLTFSQAPTDADKDATLAPVKVSVFKSDGSLDTAATGSITLALNKITGNGSLTGTLTKALVNGVATFSDLKIDGAGKYTLTATDSASPPVTQATSIQFDITVPALTWTGKGDGVNWSDPMNWDADIKPQNGDSLIFPTGSPLTTNNDLVGLSITYIDIQGSGYTLQGNSIKLTKSLTSEAGSNTYNIDTQLIGSPEIDDQTGDLTIKSVLSGGGLTIGGSGTINFTKANTYTGPTTLKAGVTIGDAVLTGAFGTNALTIGAGAKAVTIANTSGGSVTISNNVTFEDGATLAIDPTVMFDKPVKLQGQAYLNSIGPDDETDFVDLIGSGTLVIYGQGTCKITGDVASSIQIFAQAGDLYLGANLLGSTSTPQVVLTGGRVTLLNTLKGGGGIQVQAGTLLSNATTESGGKANYSGNVTLLGGTIKLSDTVDGNGLGTGHLNLNGGLFQNATSAAIRIDNATTIDSALATISGSTALGFFSKDVTFALISTLTTAGKVEFIEQVTLAAQTTTITKSTNDRLLFDGGVKGGGNFFMDGAGITVVAGTVEDGVVVIGQGKLANSTGQTIIGAKLAGTKEQVAVQDGGTVMLASTTAGATSVVSGSGDIAVRSGTLTTDTAAGAPGLINYTGNITLFTDGTIRIFDKVDGNGLGTGQLTISGGTIENAAKKPVFIDNSVALAVSANAIVHAEDKITFRGSSFKMADQSVLTLFGNVTVTPIVMVSGNVGFETKSSDSTLSLDNGVDGTGFFSTDGPGAVVISNGIGGGLLVGAFGDNAGTTGRLILQCALLATDYQITIEKGAVVQLNGKDPNFPDLVSGTGGIEVKDGGTLLSDDAVGDGGIADYSGSITLRAGGTIKVYDLVDRNALGTGTLFVQGGLIQNAGTGAVELANDVAFDGTDVKIDGGDVQLSFTSAKVTLADTTVLNATGQVGFWGNAEMQGEIFVNTVNAADRFQFFGGLQGAGTATFGGMGVAILSTSVGENLRIIADGTDSVITSALIIAAKLLSTADDQVRIVNGARVAMEADPDPSAAISGTGGIQIVDGFLVSDESDGATGIPNYSGTITVEEAGTLKYYDAIDGEGFGKGTIHVKGGLLQNSSGTVAIINNNFTFEGTLTISGGEAFIFESSSVTFDTASIVTTGKVQFEKTVTFSGLGANVETSADGELVAFNGGIKGAGALDEDGPGQVQVLGTVGAGIALVAHGQKTGATGALILAGQLTFSGNQVTIETNGRAKIDGAGHPLGTLTGTGGIVVNGGTLLAAGVGSDGGVSGYSGLIVLKNGGTIELYDTIDGDGLGKGELFLENGRFKNSAGALVVVNNKIFVQGAVNVASDVDRLKLAGNVDISSSGVLFGDGNIAITGPITGSGELLVNTGYIAVGGSNPSFNGIVALYSGVIYVTNDDALGSGKLFVYGDVNAETALVSLSDIGDPILHNPLVVTSGTLVLDGEFTFPNGITVLAGAKLVIRGAATAVIVSGPLAGAGLVVIEDGTFDATGDTSGFTGSISNQAGKDVPTLTVTDAGGVANGSPFPAVYTLTGTSGTPSDDLDGVTPTLTYYVGPNVTGVGSATAPSAAGTYTVIATFAGSATYAAVTSDPVTFSITSDQQVKTTPTLTASDAGGVYNGNPFSASFSLIGTSGQPTPSLDGVAPTLIYYVGSTASGIGSNVAPDKVGTYTVVASFAGSGNYNPVTSNAVTFVITKATPTLTVSNAGGAANGSTFPATYTLTGVSGSPSAALEGVTPTLAYYIGSTATGSPSATAPSAAGTYTVVASFAGSQDYKAVISTAVTFVISQGQPTNVPPTIGAPVSAILTQDGSLVFSPANGNAIVVADADANGKSEQLTLTVTHGKLKLKSTSGLKIVQGADNSSTVTVKGTLADLNKALNGLTYTPTGGFAGAASLNIAIDDLGAAGTGGLTASASVVITVNPKAAQKPTVTLDLHPGVSVRGQRVGMVFKTIESGRRPIGERITYHVSFGDGTTVTWVGSLNQFRSHVYRIAGTFTISVTATTKAGVVSDVLTRQIQVLSAAIETSPFNKHRTALFIGGTTGNDVFDIRKVDKHTIAVKVNGISAGTFATSGLIIVERQGGHDVIKKDGDIGRIYFG